jgi:hypothetical protein
MAFDTDIIIDEQFSYRTKSLKAMAGVVIK